MDARTLFYIGALLGFLVGITLTLIVVRVKSLFASSEVKRLRQENKALERRLEEKNRYIDEMMGHAKKLAHDIRTQKHSDGNH